MLLAYLILTAVISTVILVGTAHRHDSYLYWKYWVLASLVWPGLVAWHLFLRARRYIRSRRLSVEKIESSGDAIAISKDFSFHTVPEFKAFHTVEAEEAIIKAMRVEEGNNE